MKKSTLIVAALLATLLLFGTSMATTRNVSPFNTAATPGWGSTEFASIQLAINASVANDVISIGTGTYYEALDITKSLTITGTDRNLVVIDASLIPGNAIHTTASNLTIKNFTLLCNASTAGNFGFKIEGFAGAYSTSIDLEDVTVEDAFNGGIDFIGINGGIIKNVTSVGSQKGVGIGITDCKNITMSQITTSGNVNSAIRLTANGTYFPGGIDHITLGAGNSVGEQAEAYSEIDNPLYTVTNLDFSASSVKYRVLQAGVRTIAYMSNMNTAILGILSQNRPAAIADVAAEIYYVKIVPMFGSLKIQDAINVALPGALLNIDPGVYAETVTIDRTVTFAPVPPIVVPGQSDTPGLSVTNLVINNAAGFTLTSMLGVNGTLTFTNGNITAPAGTSLTLGLTASVVGEAGTKMLLGDLIVRRTVAAANTFGNIGFEATNVGGDLGLMRIIRTTGPGAVSTSGGSSIARRWEVYATNAAAVSFTFKWFAQEDNSTPWSPIVKARVYSSADGATWVQQGSDADVSALTPRSITIPVTRGDKYFTIGNSDTPMPVEMTAFTAAASGKKVVLNWATSTEKNNYGFDIERRATPAQHESSGQWQKVAFVEGNGTTNTAHSYTYTDAVSAGTFMYRLKQTDRNGAFEYSKTIEATVAFTTEDYAVSQNYPNPFNPTTNIRFAVKTAQHAVVKIFNAIGQEVRTLFNETAQPETMYSLTFDATGLPSGSYYYMLRTADRSEVKRMLLVK